MKVLLLLLCPLLAAAATLPIQQNIIAGSSQSENSLQENSLQDIQQQQADSFLSSNLQPDLILDTSYPNPPPKQGPFDVPFGSFPPNQQSPSDDASTANNQEQPAFGSSPFGALLPETPSLPKDINSASQQTSNFGVNQQSSFGDSPAKQIISYQLPSSDAGPAPPSAAGPLPTLNTAVSGSFGSEPVNVAVVGNSGFYLRTALPSVGFFQTKYTFLDLAQVNFRSLRDTGHPEYITVTDDDDDDYSVETEVYRLVGVAPASSIQGGAAITYSANIGDTVPVYSELDDVYEHRLMMEYMASRPQSTPYSGQGGAQWQPWIVKAETTLAGGRLAVLLDD